MAKINAHPDILAPIAELKEKNWKKKLNNKIEFFVLIYDNTILVILYTSTYYTRVGFKYSKVQSMIYAYTKMSLVSLIPWYMSEIPSPYVEKSEK